MKGLILASVMLAGMTMCLHAQVHHQGTSTNNLNSSALGLNCTATGMASLASGVNCLSQGISTHSFGVSSRAEGMYSISLGTMAIAESNYGMALGTYVKSSGIKSITIGSGYPNNMLHNGKSNSLMIGFNSNLPTLFIGSSQGPGTLGKVGIGTSIPSARLEVSAGSERGLIIRSENAPASVTGFEFISDNPSQTAIALIESGDTSLMIAADGRIRTDNTLIAKEVMVRLNVWKDDIFRNPDDLPSLDSLGRFIERHKHLPGIPPEEEVIGKDTDLGGLCVALLGKVEELTLYLLEISEQNTILRREIARSSHQNPQNPRP